MKDPAVVNELDFENSESVEKVFNEVKNLNNNKRRLQDRLARFKQDGTQGWYSSW